MRQRTTRPYSTLTPEIMMHGDLKIYGGYDWSYGSFAIVFSKELQNGDIEVAQPLVMKTTKRGLITEPCVRLQQNEAQQLFDLLWKEGYRPKDGTGNAGHIKAMDNHLQDMRKLVFEVTGKPSQP